MTERFSSKLSGKENDIVKVLRKVGRRSTPTEIGAASESLKNLGEISPSFDAKIDLLPGLDSLEEKGVLLRELVYSLSREADKKIDGKENSRHVVLVRESSLPPKIPTLASEPRRRIDPTLIVHADRSKTPQVRKPDLQPAGPIEAVQEGTKSHNADLRRINYGVEGLKEKMKAKGIRQAFLFKEGDLQVIFIPAEKIGEEDKIGIISEGTTKLISISEALTHEGLGFKKLDRKISEILYRWR